MTSDGAHREPGLVEPTRRIGTNAEHGRSRPLLGQILGDRADERHQAGHRLSILAGSIDARVLVGLANRTYRRNSARTLCTSRPIPFHCERGICGIDLALRVHVLQQERCYFGSRARGKYRPTQDSLVSSVVEIRPTASDQDISRSVFASRSGSTTECLHRCQQYASREPSRQVRRDRSRRRSTPTEMVGGVRFGVAGLAVRRTPAHRRVPASDPKARAHPGHSLYVQRAAARRPQKPFIFATSL